MWRLYLLWSLLASVPVSAALGAFLAAATANHPPIPDNEQEALKWPTETI